LPVQNLSNGTFEVRLLSSSGQGASFVDRFTKIATANARESSEEKSSHQSLKLLVALTVQRRNELLSSKRAVMAAILRAKVRRAFGGFMPLAIPAS
jgi:hypothetical protein